MTTKRCHGVWLTIAGALAALVLGIATTATLAATGGFRHTHRTSGLDDVGRPVQPARTVRACGGRDRW